MTAGATGRRIVVSATLAVATAVFATSCRPASSGNDLDVSWQVTPEAPVVGQAAAVDLTLRDTNGRPVVGARLDLEAHMAHPGMAPVVMPLTDAGTGRYRTGITWTMSGDWVMFVSGTREDGRPLRQQVAQLAVRSPD